MNLISSNTSAITPSLPDAGERRGPGREFSETNLFAHWTHELASASSPALRAPSPPFGMEERDGVRRGQGSWRGGTSVFWTLPLNQIQRFWRDVSIVFDLPRYFDASGASMQCVPDFQQNSFAIGGPLAIPEPQFLNALARKIFSPLLVCLRVFRKTVLEPVQFNGQTCVRTIEIQNISPGWMLSAKLKSRKASSSQRLPKLLFLFRLFPSQTTRLSCGTHAAQVKNLIFQAQHSTIHVQAANNLDQPPLSSILSMNPGASSPHPSPPFRMEERVPEGRERRRLSVQGFNARNLVGKILSPLLRRRERKQASLRIFARHSKYERRNPTPRTLCFLRPLAAQNSQLKDFQP